jgi:D-alanyl-D-alanine carboxypeptidase/D-alanyl-D-alanine-endopeptidase (penicillin-binding protein 4)
MPDALMFNQHLSKFTIAAKKGRHQIIKSIPGESYRVANKIKSVSKSCRGKRSWPSIRVNHASSTPVLVVSGVLSTKCPRRSYSYIITKPYKEFYEALKRQLKRSGIGYHGRMRVSRVPAGAKILYTHYSAPLEKIISVTAKKSNNLFARHLLLTLGAKIYGAPANLDKGRRAVAQILNRYRLLDTPKCHIDNGFVLSRVSKITARSMARVLDHAYKGYGRRWMRTLSIAGTDGTIRRRFRNTSVKNRAWMKTGTLNNAKNITGYVKSKRGKLYTVVILTNGKRARWYGAKMQNDIIKWLVSYSGSGVPGGRDPMREELKLKDKVIWGDITTEQVSPAASSKVSSASAKGYFVQMGSFGSVPNEAFLDRLRNGGFAYRVIEADGHYKVLAGPYSDRAQANDALSRLQEIASGAYVTQL